MLNEIFTIYSQYSGTGIIMVLFFMALIYIAMSEKDRSNQTILLYGSIVLIIFIFFPLFYYLYITFVDASTYWRLWWLVPVGIGLAYAGANLIREHSLTGLMLILVILFLGGESIYSGELSGEIDLAQNAYQIPQNVIDIVDDIKANEVDEVTFAAFPPEMLIYVRQYDATLRLPYGREMLDERWSVGNGFYDQMSSEMLDFEILAEKCRYNSVRFIVVNAMKPKLNVPQDYGFELMAQHGMYSIYVFWGV
jgi:hypothetical protein